MEVCACADGCGRGGSRRSCQGRRCGLGRMANRQQFYRHSRRNGRRRNIGRTLQRRVSLTLVPGCPNWADDDPVRSPACFAGAEAALAHMRNEVLSKIPDEKTIAEWHRLTFAASVPIPYYAGEF